MVYCGRKMLEDNMDNQFNTHFEKGNEHINSYLYVRALEEFQKAVDCSENNNQKFRALFGVANILSYYLNRNEDSLEAFKRAFTFAIEDRQRYDAKFQEALVLNKMGRYKDALVSFEWCLNYADSNDKKYELRSKIALALYLLDKTELAVEMCEKIFNDTNSTYQQKYNAQFEIGLIRGKENKYIESKEAFKKSVHFSIDDIDIIQSKFNEVFMLLNQYQFKQAVNELNSLYNEVSHKKINKYKHLITRQLGAVLSCDGQYDQAIKKLQESLNYECTNEDKYVTYHNIGDTYIKLKKYNDAINSFKQALAIDLDGERKCWQLFNISYAEILLKNYQQAFFRLDETKILKKTRDQEFYYLCNKGWLSAKLDYPFPDTLKFFNDALEYKPNSAQMNLIDFLLQIQKIEIKKGKENFYTSTNLIEIIKADDYYKYVISENSLQKHEITLAEFYFQVCKIVALLSVTHKMENKLAHYTAIKNAKELLDPKGKFWLLSIAHMNDPSEGKALLSYIKQTPWKAIIHPHLKKQAFTSCFSFNHNHLNQFRLYGNNESNVATGLSLVFERDNYFNQNNFKSFQELSYNTMKNKFTNDSINDSKPEQSETLRQPPLKSPNEQGYNELGRLKPQIKEHLFRCIYIDPKPHQIDKELYSQPISIVLAQREQHTFAYNDEHTKYGKYKNYINTTTKEVFAGLKKVKSEYEKLINNTDLIKELYEAKKGEKEKDGKEKMEKILDELCLPLRHLVKDIAFKEEQECRCIKLSVLTDSQVKKVIFNENMVNEKTRYYIENDSIAPAVTKIWIGPQCASLPAIQELVARNNLDIKVEQSQLPIRD